MIDIVPLLDRVFPIAESPTWHDGEQRLYWVSGNEGDIWSCQSDGSNARVHAVGQKMGSMALREGGGMIVGLHKEIGVYDLKSGLSRTIAVPFMDSPGLQINDGKVDSRGRFIFGALDLHQMEEGRTPPRGRLYRLDPDGSVHVLAEGVAIANGPCWSVDDSIFYFTDSLTPEIRAYDWDTVSGVPGASRRFTATHSGELPDGATIDAEDHYWCAFNGLYTGTGEIRRIAPDGSVVDRIVMPTAKVTSVAFGGPALDILFVTSMSALEGKSNSPQDGLVFAIRGLGVRGRPPSLFAG